MWGSCCLDGKVWGAGCSGWQFPMSHAHPRRGWHDTVLTRHQPAVKFLLGLFVFTWVRTQVGNQATGRVGIPLSVCAFHRPTFITSTPSSALMAAVGGLLGSTPPAAAALEEERCQTFPPRPR